MGSDTLDRRVAAVRRFSRFHTQRIGLLHAGYLGSPFSLAESRVLYELAHRDGASAAELSRDLGLDRGYLSRILGGFEKRRLLTRATSKTDGRRSHIVLTERGRDAFAPLHARSRDEIGAMLGGLTDAEQQRLVEAMQAISSSASIPSASAAGSRRRTARSSARCSWSGTPPRWLSSGCSWSSRGHADSGWDPGS